MYRAKLRFAIPGSFFVRKNQKKKRKQLMGKSPATAADLAKNGYRQQWGVIVICRDEKEQIRVYDELKKKYPDNKIKVVTT